jgi:hypothetical protein
MGLRIELFAILVGAGFLYFVLRSIQRNSMRPAYAFLWTLVSLFLLSISMFEHVYQWVAASMGIVDTRHIIYIALIGFLLVYVFYLTQKLSKLSDQIQIMLAHLAIVEDELRRKTKG